MNGVVTYSGTGAFLSEASLAGQLNHSWFEFDYWQDQGAKIPDTAGRGQVLFISRPEGQWVLRHSRRGGLVGRFNRDRYLWTGENRVRSFAEWRLLTRLRQLSLPAPKPVAAAYRRHGLFYSADLITERIMESQTLTDLVLQGQADKSVWIKTGQCIARFHQSGVYHADLNAHNILVNHQEQVYLIDFDRGGLRSPGDWCKQNLARLKRSLLKVTPLNDHQQMLQGWSWLNKAYSG